jgi:DNA-binding transcriptional ArsR family regulator
MADSGKKSKKAVINDGAEDAAERFRALGDETRLRIIWFLRCQSLMEASSSSNADEDEFETATGANVTDLCRAITGSDKLTSTFSHHLKELRHAGLINVEKDGKNRWYHLVPGALEALAAWVCAPPKDAEAARLFHTPETGGDTATDERATR